MKITNYKQKKKDFKNTDLSNIFSKKQRKLSKGNMYGSSSLIAGCNLV